MLEPVTRVTPVACCQVAEFRRLRAPCAPLASPLFVRGGEGIRR